VNTTATNTLVQSWANRYAKATATLLHAESAPAVFRPEYVEQVREEAAHAERQWNFWSRQDVAR
jgi:hypothetical protein